MKKIILVIPLILLLTSCATKQYPLAATVTPEESALMDCRDLKVEIAKTRGIQQQIEKKENLMARQYWVFSGISGLVTE